MPHLEHDMDELFQKAAENYSLKTGKSNWDTIAGRLANAPAIKRSVGPGRKKYLLAAMLLLAALLLTDIILRYNDNKGTGSIVNKKEKDVQMKNEPGVSDSKLAEDKLNTKNVTTVPSRRVYQNVPLKESLPETTNKTRLLNENYQEQVFKNDNSIIEPANIAPAGILTIKDRKTPTTPINNINKNFDPWESRGFYWGVLAGPQFSEVKRQGMKGTGFDAGVVAGYKINKKIAIESGLFYSAKYYFSDAKYFKMSPDPSMPANMVLMDLKGKTNVVTIPVKLRFDLFNNRQNKIFTTAGFSSYLLTQENNKYHAMVNGTEEYMKKSYKKNLVYGAASINISAGFEHRIIKQNFIRIEPYLQIPIKGIGVGSMPVTSAGIHIGFITNRPKR